MWLQWLWKLNTQLNDKSSKKMSKSDGNWENKMWQTQKTLIFWKIWLTDFCNFLIQQPFYYQTIPWTVFFILVLFFNVVSVFRAFFPKMQHLYTVLSNWGCFPKLLVFYVFACFVNLQRFGLLSPSIRLRDSVSQSIFSKHLSPALRLKWDMYICSQGATREKTLKFQGGITSQSALINVECALFLHERPLACVYADCDYLTAAKTPVEKEREGEWSGGKSEHNGGKKEAWHDYDESNYSRGIVKDSTPLHCN